MSISNNIQIVNGHIQPVVTITVINLFSHTVYKGVPSVTYSLVMYREYTDL
jgi:hypothetical protein